MIQYAVEVEALDDGRHHAVVLTVDLEGGQRQRYLWPVRREEAVDLCRRVESAMREPNADGTESVFRKVGRRPSIVERVICDEPRA